MNKKSAKRLFFLSLLILFNLTGVFAQTITIGNVDPGPYGQGSTVAVPFNVNDATGCIAQNNTYKLYLSDAAGNLPAGGILIGSFKGFYAAFINGIIPIGTPAGAGYKVIVTSSNPVVTSAASAAFSINANPAITAAATSQVISATYPEVFGQCNGTSNSQFTFTNMSTAGATVTASFFNELTQVLEVSNVVIPATGYVFTANAGNYTVTVKAQTGGGPVSTYAYQLINNIINTSIGSTGNTSVCLINGKGDLTFNIDVSSPTGIQFNYPGNTYTFTWGDGSPSTTLTLCQIKAANGQITHTFTKPSCGFVSNGRVNEFEIDFQPSNIYCGNIGSAPSNYANVLVNPINSFLAPLTACAGSPVVITNTSVPGPDPNATTSTCNSNPKALYTWLVDGIIVGPNYPIFKQFVLPANTPSGSHTITLHFQNGNGGCAATDFSQTICIQNAPKPIFTIPATVCLAGGAVTPTNTSVIDANCNTANQYNWTVRGPATVNYVGNTNSNSAQPQFLFTTTGTYQVQLGITTASCGTVLAPVQTIVVNDIPVPTLSPNTTLCGNNQTLNFDPNPGPTQTTITGTVQSQANTYTWTVTGGAFSFQGGTNAGSQYPQILFTNFGTYTVNVTAQNNCGTVTATQTITFVQAPTVFAGNNQNICANNPIAVLAGTISGTVNSFQWLDVTNVSNANKGTFSAPNSLNTKFVPSPTEIGIGQVTLTLQAITSLPAPCNTITSNITITITPTVSVTSPPATAICTGQPVNYNLTTNVPGSTLTWAGSVTSGTATGVPLTGSGSTITDIITNTNPNIPAVVTYVITPQNNGCIGNTFTLMVTVNPLPQITAVAVNPSICSNQPANITLTSNIPNTSYTWTSVASAGITGNTNQLNGVVTTSIQDILVNNASTIGTVTYTITPTNGTCPGPVQTGVITVQPLPVQSKPGPDDEVCNTTTYPLQGNNPSPGTGKWTQVAGPAGATFSDDTNPAAVVSGLIPGNSYQFQWAITATPTCPPNVNAVNIIIDNATVGGTTAGLATVCSGNNNGQIKLTGQVGNIIRWESSVDNGVSWQAIINVSTSQAYSNLTQTAQYRVIVQNGKCIALPSSVTTITVNQPTVIADAGTVPPVCNQTTATLNGNDPAPFSGVWSQTAGPQGPIIVNPTNHQTQITGLVSGNIYTFMWTIKGLPPCPDSQSSVDISVSADITASFSQDKIQGCGATNVTFTNTSTPTTAGTFLWDFGDGTTSMLVNPPPHTFATSTDGTETIYTVTLTPVSNCNLKTPFKSQLSVSPLVPVAKLFPNQTTACGAFTLTAQNLSPGNNVSYDFYLADVAGNILQHLPPYPDKKDAVFQPVNPTKVTDYSVYVIATDKCGNTGTSTPVTISVSPSTLTSLMQIQGDPQSICLGNSLTFQNISTGGNRFTYTVYDANKNPITTIQAGSSDFNYTPTTTGTYYVSITAGNNGCGNALPSLLRMYSVYPQPQPDFTFSVDNDYNVTFTNNTPDDGNTPAASLNYTWNFGDGSSTENTFVPNVHQYDYNKSPFTAILTAANSASNCDGLKTQTIIISFLGGIYLPNAFIPGSSNPELKIFKAKGTGIKEWQMQVFNNFGELVWETTKLDNNGSPVEGWDGTYKGLPAQQGVYVWQVSATLLNGSQWKGMAYNNSLPKRTGAIHLIR
jgi:large repetitive protein